MLWKTSSAMEERARFVFEYDLTEMEAMVTTNLLGPIRLTQPTTRESPARKSSPR